MTHTNNRRLLACLALVLLGFTISAMLPAAPVGTNAEAPVTTFSIAAFDPDKLEWAVGVASKYLAVGAVVPWAKAGVGAVATQSFVNVTYGSHGLELLEQGTAAVDVVKELTRGDAKFESRQVGIIDAHGKTAAFTGKDCVAWAGDKAGPNYTCQGNLLEGPGVVEAMGGAFEESKGALAWRVMAALEAGEKAGGDRRGRQSAAILVVRAKGGPGGLSDRAIDFRVDDHTKPLEELARILSLRLPRQ